MAHVRRTMRDRGFLNDSERIRVSCALDQALQNAYYHGNLEVDSTVRDRHDDSFHLLADERRRQSPYCDRRIRFRLQFVGDEVRIRIQDEGPGFNVHFLSDPTQPEFFQRSHGRGVFLMRAFMSEVRFNQKGNEVTLIKRR